MDENNLEDINQVEEPEQDNTALIDKMIQNNPFVKMNEGSIENVQTQSVVKSTREEASERLAQIEAQNAEILRQQKLAEDAAKAKKTTAYIVVAIIFAAIIGVGVWLGVNAIMASQKGIAQREKTDDTGTTEYGEVEGYKCQNEKCEKAADISEKTILVHDGAGFYIYATEDKKTTLTTIPDQAYHAITPFVWNGKKLVVLDPESDKSAIYSITDNRLISDFAYDEFFTDIKAAIYKDMTWIESSYIAAKSSGSYALVKLSDGRSVVQGAKSVFAHDNYFFGYENDGSIHVYSSTKKLKVVTAGSALFTNGKQFIVIEKEGGYRAYENDGEESQDEALNSYLNSIEQDRVTATLSSNSKYYRIPAAR